MFTFSDIEGGGSTSGYDQSNGGSGSGGATPRRYSTGPMYPQHHGQLTFGPANHQAISLFNMNGQAHHQMLQNQNSQQQQQQQQGSTNFGPNSYSSSVSYYSTTYSSNSTPNSNRSTPMHFAHGGGGGGLTTYQQPQQPFIQSEMLEEVSWRGAPIVASAIRDVWSFNMREEFKTIRALVRNGFNYISVDTEFPGAPVRPIGIFRTTPEYLFATLRVNCDSLRIIQAGITLMDADGNVPPGVCTWQFNFKFNLSDDMYASESIDLLHASGVQFHRLETDGIDPISFSEYLITSGLVLNEDVSWISFHSGYDFGYLFRVLLNKKIPETESDFFEYLKIFFPYLYDVKNLLKSCRGLKGGLQEISEQLGLQRLGASHQAGSDSLLTGMVFFRLKENFFENMIEEHKYNGRLYGLAFTQSYYVGDAETWSSTDKDTIAEIDSFNKKVTMVPIVLPMKEEETKQETNSNAEIETENGRETPTTTPTSSIASPIKPLIDDKE